MILSNPIEMNMNLLDMEEGTKVLMDLAEMSTALQAMKAEMRPTGHLDKVKTNIVLLNMVVEMKRVPIGRPILGMMDLQDMVKGAMIVTPIAKNLEETNTVRPIPRAVVNNRTAATIAKAMEKPMALKISTLVREVVVRIVD